MHNCMTFDGPRDAALWDRADQDSLPWPRRIALRELKSRLIEQLPPKGIGLLPQQRLTTRLSLAETWAGSFTGVKHTMAAQPDFGLGGTGGPSPKGPKPAYYADRNIFVLQKKPREPPGGPG